MPAVLTTMRGLGVGRPAPVTDLDLERAEDRGLYLNRVGIEFSATPVAAIQDRARLLGHPQPTKLRSRDAAVRWIAETRIAIFRRAQVLATRGIAA